MGHLPFKGMAMMFEIFMERKGVPPLFSLFARDLPRQRWVMWNEYRGGNSRENSWVHITVLLTSVVRAELEKDKCRRIVRDILTVVVREESADRACYTDPIYTSVTCVMPLFFFSSPPVLIPISWPLLLLLAQWEGWGLHALCMANCSGGWRRWDAVLI